MRDKSAGDAATIGEYREQQRIDMRFLLKKVEHPLNALTNERDGSDLNGYEPLVRLRLRCGNFRLPMIGR